MDNSPHSYVFQPENALPIGTFIDDPNDREARALLAELQSTPCTPVMWSLAGCHKAPCHMPFAAESPQLAWLPLLL